MSPPLIAPYWHDFDPRIAGRIFYRLTNDADELQMFQDQYLSLDLLDAVPIYLFIATWDQLPRYGGSADINNTLQVLLATNRMQSLSIFIYHDIQWGSNAQIGFNLGNGLLSYTLPGARSSLTVDIDQLSNVGRKGVFAFRIDSPGCDVNAEQDDLLRCTCLQGFYGNGYMCVDYDECSSGDNSCSREANCNNTDGGYECTCRKEFFGDGLMCLEQTGEPNCSMASAGCYCYGSMCRCTPGYRINEESSMCDDINECITEHSPCGNDQTCVNSLGSYLCTCSVGYAYSTLRKTCEDIDECTILQASDCHENATCMNTDGSFECVCLQGFSGDGRNCYKIEYDINECDSGSHDCQQLCIDTDGSYKCACESGYFLKFDGKTCLDVDECVLSYDNCNQNSSCNNTDGSYVCECNNGFYGNGISCIDIDECESGEHNCDRNAKCINTIGSYSCQCQNSFFGDGLTCESAPRIRDAMMHGRPNHDLHYFIGENFCLEQAVENSRFIVSCPLIHPATPVPEFQFSIFYNSTLLFDSDALDNFTSNSTELGKSLSISGTMLPDELGITIMCNVSNVNGHGTASTVVTLCDPTECQGGVTHNCTQLCRRNQIDGHVHYTCSCEKGYKLSESLDGSCIDRNECIEGNYSCSQSENCVNTPGSYECSCKTGFTEENSECRDIDECERNSAKCDQICNNTEGSYICSCSDGFYLNSIDNQNCININECESVLSICSPSAHEVCKDTNGSYMCECEQGYHNVSGMCEDVDECESNLNNCSYMCVNVNGSYYCECDFAFSLQGDGETCRISSEVLAGGILGVLLLTFSLVVVVGACVKIVIVCRQRTKRIANLAFDEIRVHNDEVVMHKMKSISVQSSYKLKLPPHLIIRASSIKLLEMSGQGEFGVVYKGHILKNMGQIVTDVVAIKTLKGFYDHSMVRDLLQECAKMMTFDHPNVLPLTGVCLDGGPAPYIIMPFMANGSLLSHLKRNRNKLVVLDEQEQNVAEILKQLTDMCIQVAKGMEYLASMGIVHRDLAARNCMMSVNCVIKVADFGLAVNMGSNQYIRQAKEDMVRLPIKWLAPECMEENKFSEKSDVWAYGVTCWEVFTGGSVPYSGIDNVDVYDHIISGKQLAKPNNAACSDQVYSLMKSCWAIPFTLRPSFADLDKKLSCYLECLASYVILSDVNRDVEVKCSDKGSNTVTIISQAK